MFVIIYVRDVIKHTRSQNVKARQCYREAAADNLISTRPSVSGASRGRCLTALTDKSCQSDVCNIEQEAERKRKKEVEE